MFISIRTIFLFFFSLCLFACGPTPPTEAEIKNKIKGTFCAENYKLSLTDSTYNNVKHTASVLGTYMIPESCQGTYELAYRDNGWYIDFHKDESPNAIFNCKRSYAIWTKDQEYVIGNDVVIMKDLFDEKELRKSSCDDF